MIGITSALHLAISLFAIWFLYFICWHEHRVDAFRQHMFSLRDDLFDYAQSGGISFNDPAYATLRNVANGMIRYAHRMNFSRVLAILILGNLPATNRMEDWMKDVQARPAGAREKLLKTHSEISTAVFWHIVPWSPLAWVCLALALPITVVANLLKLRVKIVRRPREISAVLEEDALEQRAVDEECLVAG